MKYNLTIARPAGFLHTSAFIEVRDSLAWGLAELGHEANCSENLLIRQDAINILFGAETLTGKELIPDNTIIYNLEQPGHPSLDVVRRVAVGKQVWDYSLANVNRWLHTGYDVRHLPIAYTPYLTRIPPSPIQDIDVLFYGWLTPRRLALRAKLEERGWKVVFTDQAYGGGRDQLISRSKVCLNVHHDGRDMLEMVRISYLLANSKCVISEVSIDDLDYDYLELSRWSYDLLPHACSLALSNSRLRRRLEQKGFARFKREQLVTYLEEILETKGEPSESALQ